MPRGYIGKVVSRAEASRRWRERNPDKVRAAQKRRPRRTYDPIKLKAWRQKRLSDPAYRKKIAKQANERNRQMKTWLAEYKVQNGCVDCGFRKHHAALHFDHVRGQKSFNICFAKSLAQAKKEIEKCDVRCANCHSIRTFEERKKIL